MGARHQGPRGGASLYVSRESVDILLSVPRRPRELICRIGVLRRLAEDSERFFPLPSLLQSLQHDISRISARLEGAGECRLRELRADDILLSAPRHA